MTEKVPTVTREPDGSFSVRIAPETVLRWRFEADSYGSACCLTVETAKDAVFLKGDRNVQFPVRVLQ
jgi:hypothetical protein